MDAIQDMLLNLKITTTTDTHTTNHGLLGSANHLYVTSLDFGHDGGPHRGLGGRPRRAPEEDGAQAAFDDAVLRTSPTFNGTTAAMVTAEIPFYQSGRKGGVVQHD